MAAGRAAVLLLLPDRSRRCGGQVKGMEVCRWLAKDIAAALLHRHKRVQRLLHLLHHRRRCRRLLLLGGRGRCLSCHRLLLLPRLQVDCL